jgi:AcrR family transcriptional regulator
MRDSVDTRDRIDRAAIRLFAQQGVDGTSIRQIAKAANISLGALYNHYRSKESMVEALFSRNWALVGQELRRISHENKTLDAQILQMVRYVFGFFERDWELASLTFSQRHSTIPRLRMARDNPYLAFRMTIVSAMSRGEIPRQDPDIATAMLIGAIVQVIDTRMLGRIKKKLTPSAVQVANACVALLRSNSDPNSNTQSDGRR